MPRRATHGSEEREGFIRVARVIRLDTGWLRRVGTEIYRLWAKSQALRLYPTDKPCSGGVGVALDLQQRTTEHGTGWHHTLNEGCARCLAPLLAPRNFGGITARCLMSLHDPRRYVFLAVRARSRKSIGSARHTACPDDRLCDCPNRWIANADGALGTEEP